MSGRRSGGPSSGRRPWDKPRTPAWAYALVGVLLTLVVVLAIVIVMLLGSGNGGLAAASSTPTAAPGGATPTAAASAAGPTAAAAASASPGPTAAVTPAATEAPSSPAGTPSASGSTKPTITAFKGPRTADCQGMNGTQVLGDIHLSWTAENVTGVRLAIDDPDPKVGYAAPFGDYPPTDAEDVPYSCDFTLSDSAGPYHLYTLITDHTTGYWQYRFIKVYQSPRPTATP
jgi:hypothetical protein